MSYPRKSRGFPQTDFEIETTRRKAITAAYKTIFQEMSDENNKLRKTVQQLHRANYMNERTILSLETEIERNNDRRVQP